MLLERIYENLSEVNDYEDKMNLNLQNIIYNFYMEKSKMQTESLKIKAKRNIKLKLKKDYSFE